MGDFAATLQCSALTKQAASSRIDDFQMNARLRNLGGCRLPIPLRAATKKKNKKLRMNVGL